VRWHEASAALEGTALMCVCVVILGSSIRVAFVCFVDEECARDYFLPWSYE
jgi:hypothetical protein